MALLDTAKVASAPKDEAEPPKVDNPVKQNVFSEPAPTVGQMAGLTTGSGTSLRRRIWTSRQLRSWARERFTLWQWLQKTAKHVTEPVVKHAFEFTTQSQADEQIKKPANSAAGVET